MRSREPILAAPLSSFAGNVRAGNEDLADGKVTPLTAEFRPGRLAAVLFITVVAAGCATARYTPVTRYALEPEVRVSEAGALPTALGVRTMEAARPYKQRVVYRDSGFVVGSYDTIEWAELPADVVTRTLIDAIAATHRFKDVGNAGNLPSPDLILTGTLRRFDEVHTTDPWAAECEVRLELRDIQQPEALWAATLTATEPLDRNQTSALPAAMSRAVAKIVKQAVEAIVSR